jgi:hypothetical protein
MQPWQSPALQHSPDLVYPPHHPVHFNVSVLSQSPPSANISITYDANVGLMGF